MEGAAACATGMGSGASKKNAAEEKKRKAQKDGGLVEEDEATGSRFKDQSPSRRRRRRVLFQCRGAQPRPFEKRKPEEQFWRQPEEDDDPVFARCGKDECQQFRDRAQGVRYSKSHDEGFLDENSIELLGLELDGGGRGGAGGSSLAKRLFEVAQVQELEGNKRPDKLTCYELLALYSVLRYGTRSELLELLFCVCDFDDDDMVSEKDLKSFVTAFLKLEEDFGVGMSEEDEQDFKQLDPKAIDKEAAQMASRALKEFWEPEPDEDSDAEAPDPDGEAKSEDEASDTSADSKKAASGADGARKGAKKAMGKAPRSKSPAPKPKKKQGGCFGGGGKKKGPKALTFEQWKKWLQESSLLPDEWAAALLEAEEAPVPTVAHDQVASVQPVVTQPVVVGSGNPASDTEGDSPQPRGASVRQPPADTQRQPLLA